jgi:hypothetical protein
MLIASEKRPPIRTLRGWAIHVLQEAGAIRECEEHCRSLAVMEQRGGSSPRAESPSLGATSAFN